MAGNDWIETAKSNSRSLMKNLRVLGANKGTWFAVLDNIVVASGKSRKDVEERLAEILPADKIELVHFVENKN